MKIPRHPIDIKEEKAAYLEEYPRMLIRIELARKSNDVLSTLSSIATSVYQMGSAIAPDTSEVAQALRLGAQANTALLVFAQLGDRPRYLPLGDGPPVTYSEPTDASYVHPYRWVDAFRLGVVTRQVGLVAALCAISTEQLKESPTRGEQWAYDWADLHRALWQDPSSFTRASAFVACEQDCLESLRRGKLDKAVRLLTVPYFEVLRRLEQRDEPGFADALAKALRQHQDYWGATAKHRNKLEGFVSLQLTAAAVLAYDCGLRFDVQSDYMPASWVTGELFRSPRPVQ
jgi:hypothetical protein